MSLEVNLKKILIIDFGSQFTQLIARRVRELGVYSEIISHKKINKQKDLTNNVIGIILSGGYSPTIKTPIGTAYIEKKYLKYTDSAEWYSEVRGKLIPINFSSPVMKKQN